MDTAEYNAISNQTMDSLTDYLEELIETIAKDGYDVEYSSGVLTLALDTKGTFVINKQPPNKQIWLSSPISGPKRYDYDADANAWFYSRDDSTLKGLLDTELRSLLENETIDVDLGRN